MDRFTPFQSQFRTWLYRIVTNLCYNRLPNLRRSLNDLGDDVMENIPETESPFDNPAHEFESNDDGSFLSIVRDLWSTIH